MSATSFLFQGVPPPNLNVTSSESATLPVWYQEYLQGLMGTSNALAAAPFPQYTGPTIADFNPTQQQAFSMTGALPGATSGATGAASSALGHAANQNIPGAVQPYLSASTSDAYNPSMALSPYNSTASNYLNQATNTATPQGIQSYMSPYMDQVVQGMQDQANRNWTNNIMPGISNSFIGAGQYGSGRNAQVLGQAANDFQSNLSANVANALETGYGLSGQQAATQAGILGSGANTALGQGTAAGSAAGQGATIQQGAGSLAGTATAQQGALSTNIAGANTTLSNALQNIALQNAAAEQTVGNQQQAQTQNNLTTAYNQFQQQAAYPQQQASFMSDIIRGLQVPTSTSVNSNQAPNPLTQYSPSVGNQLSALFGTGSVHAEGGLIKGYAKGGHVHSQGRSRVTNQHAAILRHLAATPARNVPYTGGVRHLPGGLTQLANGDLVIPYAVLQQIGMRIKSGQGLQDYMHTIVGSMNGGGGAPAGAMPPQGAPAMPPPPPPPPPMRGALSSMGG